MRLTQELVDVPATRDTWLSDGGSGLLLRTHADGRRSFYWHRREGGKAKRTKIADARDMTLVEARAWVRRDGQSADLDARCRELEDEVTAYKGKVDALEQGIVRLFATNGKLIDSHNRMVDLFGQLGVQPVHADHVNQTVSRTGTGGTLTVKTTHAGGFIEREPVGTFAEYARRWIDLRTPEWSAGSRTAYLSRMNNHVVPQFGKREIDDIAPRDVADFLNDVPSRSTRGSLGIILRGVFGVAVAEGRLAANPAAAAQALVSRCGADTEHRAMLAVEDAPAVFRSLGDGSPGTRRKASPANRRARLRGVRRVAGGSRRRRMDGAGRTAGQGEGNAAGAAVPPGVGLPPWPRGSRHHRPGRGSEPAVHPARIQGLLPFVVRTGRRAVRSRRTPARPQARQPGRTRLPTRRPPRRTARSHAAVGRLTGVARQGSPEKKPKAFR